MDCLESTRRYVVAVVYVCNGIHLGQRGQIHQTIMYLDNADGYHHTRVLPTYETC